MIIDLPDTTTAAVTKALVRLRDEGGAVALGRVLTLVIDADGGDVEPAVAAANDASREHPCRVIVLARDTTRTTASLDAQIRVGGDAGASEVVVLRASGEILAHSDTLVMPLLLPDAPIVLWWPFEVPDRPADHPIGAMAQRRITDTLACADPAASLVRLRSGYTAGDTDLAWTRLTRWRGLLAAALDQPPHEKVTRAVVSGHHTHPSVVLLAAWLAHALRCPVEIVRQRDVQGITKVVLERASGNVVIDRPDGRVALLDQPGQPERRTAMPMRELHECLAEELRRLDPDEVYGEVLHDGLSRIGAA
ncbi:glucose-6-phosphate dehydrogenase assembly protein OpcA [Actinotalea sp.]|uniref:glucose-6-phosphate dehydrogenase assembly protein OpcA n=1 Tax=Actinotalea sp. TaxID=1872145 RepID=UPI002BFEA644|nr:glucose-6-phosphate dehydrogenase assembly protein OpcA [Actinotalea sp.]HQY33276.1 glucose-6-phosphate dehydrogenase assembly protein OpcA [Actinotalea sp.]HRA50574.1 glucose-6-phosphate dehydrogenase assembly protein OpcA [Actinotalea sp.]